MVVLLGALIWFIIPQNDDSINEFVQKTTDAFSSVYDIILTPVEWFDKSRAFFTTIEALQHQNDRLKAENDALKLRHNDLYRYELLLEQYEKQLALPMRQKLEFVTARVLADLRGAFVHTFITNVGRKHGIMPGQVAVGVSGFVGRVIAAGEESSRVLLVTDYNSHIPVLIGKQRIRAVMEGDNSAYPTLRLLQNDAPVKAGDIILTSSDGGLLPSGLVVGTLIAPSTEGSASPKKRLRVQMAQASDQMTFIRILLASLPEMPPQSVDIPDNLKAEKSK